MAPAGKSLPSPSANSSSRSLPPQLQAEPPPEGPGGFRAGSGRCRCLQLGLTPPHPKRPSHPARWSLQAAEQLLSGSASRGGWDSIASPPPGSDKNQGLCSAQPLGARSCQGLSTKFAGWRRRGRQAALLSAAACPSPGKGWAELPPSQAVYGPVPGRRWLSLCQMSQPCLGIAPSCWAAASGAGPLLTARWHGHHHALPCAACCPWPGDALGASPRWVQPPVGAASLPPRAGVTLPLEEEEEESRAMPRGSIPAKPCLSQPGS